MSRDRCSPDVHWTFEHLSFLPCPQAPHVAGPMHGLPRADRGQQQHGSHRDSPSQGAPHHGSAVGMSPLSPCSGESPGPPRSQYGSSNSPAAPASSSFPTDLALSQACSRSWACAGEGILLETQSVFVVTRGVMQNGSFQAFSL